jgi:hypothetical protein
MNLYIPELKDQIKLTKDWSFNLYSERRNETLGKRLGLLSKSPNHFGPWIIQEKCTYWNEPLLAAIVTIPKDTVLIIDRIYIRNGEKEYSSITFRIKDSPNKKLNKARFWAKLIDTRSIEFENTL